jgi:TolB-like protein/tRNA A-37 threonylcarbamoyl transferase component Bud32/Tfp pilus assembly protein PilF
MSLIGSTVSHYKILEKIGGGGMGVVYKAADTKLKRHVALKFLTTHLTQNPEAKKRFILEAQAASALQHNNICKIHEINETDEGQIYLSMEYYSGKTLKEKIGESGLTVEEALDIITQIARGLEKAHSKGIVHRDIKPANIMVTDDGVVKIVDFGLAKLAGQTKLTKTGSTLGTVAYMSPEQTQGLEIDHRTDIWALGVILYEMLAGEHPFKGEYDQAVVYSILNEDPDPVSNTHSGIPESIEEVVARALEKDPERRYPGVEELLDDLKSISAGIVPKEIRLRLRRARLLRRKRAILYSAAAGFIIIMAAAALRFFTGGAETIDSIAVLPLENLTGETGKEYFVDAATDELIGQLARIGALRVISRQSVMRYKESDKSLPEIARELNVDAVVEGTVYQAGESVRIRLQLIDALPEERNLWTQTYERPMTDILVMYSEMARTMADTMRVKLTLEEETRFASVRQVNPEAYDAYLKGRSSWYRLTMPNLETALEHFEAALDIDPDYALAYTGVALVWMVRNQMNFAPRDKAVPIAVAATGKALELDSTLAEAHYSQALIRTWIEWDWEGAERAFRKAIGLNPNFPDARAWYSIFLSYFGRDEEALLQIERAIELDPFNGLFYGLYGTVLIYQRRYDDAMAAANTGLALENNIVARGALQYAYMAKGMCDEQLVIQRARIGLDHERAAAFDRGLEEGGYEGAQRGVAEVLASRYGTTGKWAFSAQTVALRYLDAGDYEKAIDWLETAYEDRDPNLPYLGRPTYWDALHSYPRYRDLLRRMGLPLVDE